MGWSNSWLSHSALIWRHLRPARTFLQSLGSGNLTSTRALARRPAPLAQTPRQRRRVHGRFSLGAGLDCIHFPEKSKAQKEAVCPLSDRVVTSRNASRKDFERSLPEDESDSRGFSCRRGISGVTYRLPPRRP